MKEIYYSKNNVFLLTDEEYKTAKKAWDQKKNFVCVRLDDAILSPHVQFTRTPLEDQGYEMFVLVKGDRVKKVFKNGNEYLMNFIENDVKCKSRVQLSEEEILKLIPQEEYFKNIKISG